MSLTAAQPTRLTNNFNIFEAFGAITQAGSYVSGGVTLDLSGLGVPSNSVPDQVEIDEEPPTGTVASGYTFRYAKGTTQANGKVQAFASGGNELGAVTFASVNIANLVYPCALPEIPVENGDRGKQRRCCAGPLRRARHGTVAARCS